MASALRTVGSLGLAALAPLSFVFGGCGFAPAYSCSEEGRRSTARAADSIREWMPSGSVQVVDDCDSGGEYTLALSPRAVPDLESSLTSRYACGPGTVSSLSKGSGLDCTIATGLTMNVFFPSRGGEAVEGLVLAERDD